MSGTIIVEPKPKLIVINRSGPEKSPIIADILHDLCEVQSDKFNVYLFTQAKWDRKGYLYNICSHKPFFPENVHYLKKIIDSIFFSLSLLYRLLLLKPEVVYVTTDPPVISALCASLYCRLFKKKMIYHVHDIYPELLVVSLRLHPLISIFVKALDNFSLRKCSVIIVLSSGMKKVLQNRTKKLCDIYILNNPAPSDVLLKNGKIKNIGITFSGTMGRAHYFPLIIESVEEYLFSGGKLKFLFLGGGYHLNLVENLAQKFPKNVTCMGYRNSLQAVEIVSSYKWSLLPLNENISGLGFPSKAATLAVSGSNIITITGKNSELWKWTQDNCMGICVLPKKKLIVETLSKIEKNEIIFERGLFTPEKTNFSQFSFEVYSVKLNEIVIKYSK